MTERVPCPRCRARYHDGRVEPVGEVVCDACKGEGLTYLGGGETDDCPRCEGEGAHECPTCQGTRMTDTTGAAAYLLTEDEA